MREVDMSYMALRLQNSSIKRYLFAHTAQHPHFGDPTFDFLTFFGFGSGELRNQYPMELAGIKFTAYELDMQGKYETNMSLISYLLNNTKGDHFGFVVHKGKVYVLKHDPENGEELYHHAMLDWSYYTPLGNRRHADGILGAMERHHFMNDYQDQLKVLSNYKSLVSV